MAMQTYARIAALALAGLLLLGATYLAITAASWLTGLVSSRAI